MTRDGRRRLWRWGVAVWLVTAAVGGGLTLWLQDAAEPPQPRTWRSPESTTPGLSLPEGWEKVCPTPTIDPDEDGVVAYACVLRHG